MLIHTFFLLIRLPPCLFNKAAISGLKSLPEQRFRRAYLHLQYSYADLHQLRDTPPAVRWSLILEKTKKLHLFLRIL